MAKVLSSPGIVLYIWPSRWDLPSFDPSCLAAVLYLQHTIPGKFSIVECTDPDISQTGQLPFLVHEHRIVSPLSSILKYEYVTGLHPTEEISNANLDTPLTSTEKSQKTAWCAHVELNVGDLVYHMLYSHHGNWVGLTHPSIVSMLPVPQRYYVPERIRASYKPRLESSQLWNLPDIGQEGQPSRDFSGKKGKDDNTKIYLQAFEREKVLDKAQSTFDIYTRLLAGKDFFYQNRITTLDIILAAHILLLLNPVYPDPFLQTLVTDSYPTLTSHARRVLSQAFDPPGSSPPKTLSQIFSWRSLLPWSYSIGPKQPTRTRDDIQFDRMRWGFYGLVLGSVAAFFVIVGGPQVKLIRERLEESGLLYLDGEGEEDYEEDDMMEEGE